MSPWQALIAGTKPSRAECAVARRMDAPTPQAGAFPAAAIVHTKGRKGVRLIPVQVVDFYRGRV